MNGVDTKNSGYDEKLYKKFFELVGSPEEGRTISQSKAAQSMGYSAAVISAYKNRTYNGDVKAVEKRMETWLKRQERRLTRVDIPTAETAVIDLIREVIATTQDEAGIAVIIGGAGSGKTTAIRQYEEESRSALIVDVDPSFSQVVLMNAIAHTLGLEDKGGMNAVIDRIINALTGRDAVLIIDEADYLSDGSLELVRRIINDKARIGVVLVGLPTLEYKIRSFKTNHEQIASRVGALLKIGNLTRGDAEKIISGVWKSLPKETIDAFIKGAGNSTRTLVKLMGRAYQLAERNRKEVPDAEIVAAAGEYLMR